MSLALEARAMNDDILIGDTPKAIRRRNRLERLNPSGRLWKHSKITDIYGVLSEREIAEFFVFTLVRNPWDRVVSYYHWLKVQSFSHMSVEIAKATEFSPFLNHPHTMQSLLNDNFEDYVSDRNGTERCNLFARIEYLQEDLRPLEKHLGFAFGKIEKSNQSERINDYRAYYSDEDAGLVAGLFANDISRFGYVF